VKLAVLKYGGSSVATPEKIRRAAQTILKTRQQGYRVVTVVSAPGDMTDNLIEMAREVCKEPDGREMDMLLATGEQVSIALLSMAIRDKGVDAISLTGPQAGIHADARHTKARITQIRPAKVLDEIKNGRVVIVAGFQGLNPNSDITTLGRGGSDLTAVALAAALKADVCEIFTDVTGVFTADPRIVPDAKQIDHISYDEMLELAGSGAQVMQARSIEVAKKYGVKIHVRSSLNNQKGTLIANGKEGIEQPIVSGVAYDPKEAKLTIAELPDRPGIAAQVFGALARENINVDMIIQSSSGDDRNDISFTVPREDLSRALRCLEKVKTHLGAKSLTADPNIAKVAIIGVGMRSHPGVAARMFSALAQAKINIQMISTSEIKVACVVAAKDGKKAVKVLHSAFELSRGGAN